MLGVASMGSGPRTTALACLLAAGAVLAGGIVLVSTLAFLCESHWPGPAVDFWHFMKLLNKRAAGAEWWPLLVQEHGGHRLLFPKLLYLVEYAVFDGRNVFLIISSVLLQGLTAGLVVLGVWHERAAVGRPLAVFVGGLVVALLFSGAQVENFVRPWNLHWYLVHAAVSVAIVAGARCAGTAAAHPASSTGWLSAAVLVGLVATWSMANGLLVWPILVGLAWLLRLPTRALAGLGVVAVVGAASFFVGYDPHQNVVPSRLLAEPGVQILWLLRALGTPVSVANSTLATIGGTVGLACGGLAGWDLVRRRSGATAVEPLLAGLFLFGVGTLVLVATGRAASTWSEPRYQTTVLVTWTSLLVFGLLRVGRMSPRRKVAAMASGLVWLAVPGAQAHWRGLDAVRPFIERMHAANLAILVGIDHRPSYQVTLPFADRLRKRDRVQRFARGLRRREQGMFVDGHHHLLGSSVDLVGAESHRGACGGEVRELVPLGRAGIRADGVVLDGDAIEPGVPLLLSDDDGQVVGLGAIRGSRWTAFAMPLPSASQIHVLARLHNDHLCPLTSTPTPPLRN